MNYWNDIPQASKDNIERGMFIILPLKYGTPINLKNLSFDGETSLPFESSDFTELLSMKCENGDFVRRFRINTELGIIETGAGIQISDSQLFVFQNHIAFLTIYLSYINKNVDDIYYFINPGYVDEPETIRELQRKLINDIEGKILSKLKPIMKLFGTSERARDYVLKEAYRMNVAYMPKRFDKRKDAKKITYNEHRMIDLSRKFEDSSELDVEYVTGAKDVKKENYGWGCAITSQEISYAYAKGGSTLLERAMEDLLLTILVMHQKYTCIMLNEEIHQRYLLKKDSPVLRKSIHEIRKEALEFISYGTLAPSQISRWNNVCDTYRYLIEKNGVNEALEEVKEKINLLNDEQERMESKRENTIGMIIATFGLISIIGAILQITDYLLHGGRVIWTSFYIASACVMIFALILLFTFLLKKRKKE